MGYGLLLKTKLKAKKKPTKRGVRRTHKALRYHPNFAFPKMPDKEMTTADIVDYVLESVARFVSPPKEDGENEEFSCQDVAGAIREKLKPELLERLNETVRH